MASWWAISTAPRTDLAFGVKQARNAAGAPALEVKDLEIRIHGDAGAFAVVSGMSLSVAPGETVCLVGESGCGKSMTALSLLGLLPKGARVTGGEIRIEGRDLNSLSRREMRGPARRAHRNGFQDPMTALNPVMTIGDQIAESRAASSRAAAPAAERAVDTLRLVRMPDPERRARQYPHQLSGGMRQRAMIAMALACEPKLIVADEPTTALDVTIQAQILGLMRDLQGGSGMAHLLITHDLGVVAEVADRVVVMYAGRPVEQASVYDLFDAAAASLHGRADGCDSALCSRSSAQERLTDIGGAVPAMWTCRPAAHSRRAVRARSSAADRSGRPMRKSARAISPPAGRCGWLTITQRRSCRSRICMCIFRSARACCAAGRTVRAVDGVSFDRGAARRSASSVNRVAESRRRAWRSCDLLRPTSGGMRFEGEEIAASEPRRAARASGAHADHFSGPVLLAQSALFVGDAIREPLDIHELAAGASARNRSRAAEQRRAASGQAERYPHEFSGGQRQRIGIARALALEPRSDRVRRAGLGARRVGAGAGAQFAADLQRELGVSYLFISHDLAVVEHIADRVAVMYLGQIVEIAPAKRIFAQPTHPYTELLIGSVPSFDPRKRRGFPARNDDVASATNRPGGCAFHPRCPLATELCRKEEPPLTARADGRSAACHHR